MPRTVPAAPKNADFADLFQRYSLQNYAPAPIAFERGRGARLWDVEGKAYLDFAAGVAVCSTGHAHPAVANAIADQAKQLLHTSNLYLIPNQLRLAQELVELSSLSRAFFCNSGAEAVEAAMKLARYWGHQHGGRYEIIAADNSFHGRTLGALSVTNQKKYQDGFEPLLPGVVSVPFGDRGAVEAAIGRKTCAVLVEPIQGEGGVHAPSDRYLPELRALCDERDLLLLLDEVQTGIGRTGRWFAYQHADVHPDVVALAKGLGSGFPVGALLANDRAAAFRPGSHGSTFGGGPLATAAALATLKVLKDENVLANVERQSAKLLESLRGWEKRGLLRSARGRGLLVGFDVAKGDGKTLSKHLLQAGLLVTNIHETTIRICPPLTITSRELEEGLGILGRVLGA